jgi:hypothetical protein
MKKIVRLKESDLQRIVNRVIRESMISELGGMDDGHPFSGTMNFNDLSPDERQKVNKYYRVDDEDLTDDDEYYGTFDDEDIVDRNNRRGDIQYDDFEEEEFGDFDSFKNSKYGRDRKNKWDLNTSDEESSRMTFDRYQEKSGGNPFKVRRKR